MLLGPTISLGWQYRVNDREVSFDPSEAFGGGDLGSAFEPIYGNLGYIFGEMFDAGWIDNEDCDQLAVLNGFASCAELSDAFLNGEELSPPSTDDSSGDVEPVVVQPKSQHFFSLQGNWPISPRTITMGSAANHNLKAAAAQRQQNRDAVMLSVVRTYAAAWQAQEAAELQAAQLEAANAHLSDTQALQEAGMVTGDTLLRARLELERARRGQAQGQQQQRQALRGLRLALGKPSLPFGRLEAIPSVQIDRLDSINLGASAIEDRPEAQAARARNRAATDIKADAVVQFLPQFSVTGNLSVSDRSSGFDTQRTSWWIGLGVNLPIWDGGQRIKNARDAASKKRQAEAQLEAVRQQVSIEAENAWDAFVVRRDALPVVELELELATQLQTLVESRYRQGLATQAELLDALAALAGSRFSLLQARTAREVAAAELLAAAGHLSEISH
jgi:outer membrane protein TolC